MGLNCNRPYGVIGGGGNIPPWHICYQVLRELKGMRPFYSAIATGNGGNSAIATGNGGNSAIATGNGGNSAIATGNGGNSAIATGNGVTVLLLREMKVEVY